jgi:hypothetical protein
MGLPTAESLLTGTYGRVRLERLSSFDRFNRCGAGINFNPHDVAESRRELFSAGFRLSGELQSGRYLDQVGNTRGHLFERRFKQLCCCDNYFGGQNQGWTLREGTWR